MRNARSLTLGLGLALLPAGCADPPAAQPDPEPFVVENADVWSGSSLTVRSAGFVPADPVAVLLDTDTLAFTRVNDSTLRVGLPDAPGTHQLRISSAFVLPIPVPVHLNGYIDTATGPVFSGRVARGVHLTQLFGNGPFGLRRWDVRTGETVDYPDSMHVSTCTRGVGIGSTPGELVLQTGTCAAKWRTWQVEPSVTRGDSTPLDTDRFLDVLGGGLYVTPGSHWFNLWSCDTACQWLGSPRGESGFDIVHSPVGDRAVLLAYSVSDSGAPMIDVGAKRITYIPPFRASVGAAFSEQGDTLFLVGQDHAASIGGSGLVAAVRATDGTPFVLDTTNYSLCGVALDPARPLLYVAGVYRNPPDYWSVLGVLDRATLQPIVTLRTGEVALFGSNPCTILPNPLERRIYVVSSFDAPFDPRIQAWVVRFETPP